MGFSLFFTLKHQGRDALNQKSHRRRISLILKEILFHVTEFSGPKIVTYSDNFVSVARWSNLAYQ